MKSNSTHLLLVALLAASVGGLITMVMRSREPGELAEAPSANVRQGSERARTAPREQTDQGSSPAAASTVSATPGTETAEDPALQELRRILETPASAVPQEVVLTFADAAALQRFMQAAKAHGLEWVQTVGKQPIGRFRYAELGQLNAALKASKDKPQIEPNLWQTVPQIPKEDAGNQGGSKSVGQNLMASIGATGDRSKWGQGVTVAVLDTGVKTHPTFGQSQITHLDLVADGSTMHSHGTSVASLIAGTDEQVPGVAPASHILDIRVANDKGLSVSTVIADGIYAALDGGARVINVSMGGEGDSPLLRRAIDDAWSRGAIVVAAAGNEKHDTLSFPAAVSRVISVGSVDANRQQAYFSNSGTGLDIVAPGVGLTVAWDVDKMAYASGTSHSTAVVSGAIAAMLSQGIPITDIERQLKNWAKPTGASQDRVGAGVLWLNF